jgi:hypothetical protein
MRTINAVDARMIAMRYLDIETFAHSERVALNVNGRKACVVAWLHDVIEDGTAPNGSTIDMRERLIRRGVEGEILAAVELLTRGEESYAAYIDRIANATGCAGRLARRVKLADLNDNLSRGGAKAVTLRARYLRARKRLSRAEPCAS